MPRPLRIALCVHVFALGLASSASAQTAHHAPLFYLSSEDLTREAARPLLAYVDEDGAALDWMFDTMIVLSLELHLGGGDPPTAGDVALYEDQPFGADRSDGLRLRRRGCSAR